MAVMMARNPSACVIIYEPGAHISDINLLVRVYRYLGLTRKPMLASPKVLPHVTLLL